MVANKGTSDGAKEGVEVVQKKGQELAHGEFYP